MKVIDSIDEMRQFVKGVHRANKTIAFVPTMGALHEGHVSLIRKARQKGDCVVVSIFLNPIQFPDRQDLKNYPKPFKKDIGVCERYHVDAVFCPAQKEMYPTGFSTYVAEEVLSQALCGKYRPGHFRGVTTVVAKLFNIVEPDIAFFGEKDAQQALIIQKMVCDLGWDIKIEVMPTVREDDGLALSSRNNLLSARERQQALSLNEALFMAKVMVLGGERSVAKVKNKMRKLIASQSKARLDYIEIVDRESLTKMNSIRGKILIALAVKFGKVRLIDNLKVQV